MHDWTFVPLVELEAQLERIRTAPNERGTLEQIVRRPKENRREVLAEGELDLHVGLVGDNWLERGGSCGAPADPEMQLNIMNARAVAAVCPNPSRRAEAGDQLYVDFDISVDNLPVGTRLAIGEAIVEVTAVPHNGCKKFAKRFGEEAVKFVNSPTGKQLRLRGLNAKVVQPGRIRAGDAVVKLPG